MFVRLTCVHNTIAAFTVNRDSFVVSLLLVVLLVTLFVNYRLNGRWSSRIGSNKAPADIDVDSLDNHDDGVGKRQTTPGVKGCLIC